MSGHVKTFGASVAQSSEQAPFTSEIVGSILATDSCMTLMWKESVNALPKLVGFLRVLRFPPTGNVDRVGWDYPPNWHFHRGCAPWPDMSHKVAAIGALTKPSTRSCWAASLVIQLSSQLQVRMISTPHLLTYLHLEESTYHTKGEVALLAAHCMMSIYSKGLSILMLLFY